MAANNTQEWEVYYKNDHKVYTDLKKKASLETFVIILLKKSEVAMGFKFVMRNVKNDLDFYSAHIIPPLYNEIKREHNLYSGFLKLHKNMTIILEANKYDTNNVTIRLQNNKNDSLVIKVTYSNGITEDMLFLYPIDIKNSFDIIYFLKLEMEFEASMGKHQSMKAKVMEKQFEKERVKNEKLLTQFQKNCEKITQLENRNELMWIENYQCQMHILDLDEENKRNFCQLTAAEETNKNLNKKIIALKTEKNSAFLGIQHFMRTISSLSEDVETVIRTPMPRHQFLNMLEVFNTGVLELAKIGTKLTRIIAAKQEPSTAHVQFRSAVLSQTRLIAVLQDIWKDNRVTVEEACAIRKMTEEVTYEIVRKFGNKPVERLPLEQVSGSRQPN